MQRLLFTLLTTTFFLIFSFSVQSAELAVARIQTVIAPELGIHFKAMDAADLAGIKLVLHYDAERIKYKGMSKSKETRPMMHVVNDKNPGKLIIVMASATGQKTADFNLFDLTFDLIGEAEKKNKLEIELRSIEMMSAALVEIPCSVQTFRLE